MDKRIAEAFADELDLDRIPYCSACMLELAWIIAEGGRPHPSTVGRIADWTWAEIEGELRAQVVRLRMREVLHAEDALNDIEQRAFRGRLARVVVTRLAERMAKEIASGRGSSP
jgi:hypothetical protein